MEGFGDIVFGFAISQCAIMLTNARGRVDISHPTALLLYFATFAILASLWLSFHRFASGPFKPDPIDLTLAFAFLAIVSLIPYAMYAQTHSEQSLASARVAVGEYSALYAALSTIGSIVSLRNLRRGWRHLEAEERDLVWTSIVRGTVLAAVMFVSTVVDVLAGPTASGILDLSIFVLIRVARRLFPHAPNATKLRIATPA